MFSRSLLATSLAMALLAPAGAALAQTPPPPPSMQPGSTDFSEDTLRQFVTASFAVNEVVATLQQEYNAAGTDEEANQIQLQAQEQMAASIEQSGLSVQEFNNVQAAAQADPELAARIRALAEDMQQQ